jgi:RND family efflux transporter MFP subunit
MTAPTRVALWLRPRVATRRRRLWLALAAGAIAALSLAALLRGPAPAQVIPTASVARGDVRITITESGELRAENQATVSAPTDKQIVWLVPEGTVVKQGDLLLRFESQKYEIAKSAAESALAVARAQLQKTLSDLAAHRATEEKARLEYEALPALAEKGFINRNELDGARLAYEEVRASSRAFQATVDAARATVQQAEQEVNQQNRKLKEGSVRAPRDGVVVYATTGDVNNPRKITVGMVPFEGMDLMYLPDPSSMRVDAEISEFDLAKVRVGSPVELRLDAYPDAIFRGEVDRIASLARQKISQITGKPIGVKVFDVSIKVLDQDERLKPGLTTTVEILVSENPGVLYVPVAGVFVDELDRTVVYLRDGEGVRVQPVELGGSTDRVAIVRSGLAEGDLILLAPPESV